MIIFPQNGDKSAKGSNTTFPPISGKHNPNLLGVDNDIFTSPASGKNTPNAESGMGIKIKYLFRILNNANYSTKVIFFNI